MTYIGSWQVGDTETLTFVVNTQRFDTGAATDADAVPTYRVYENETTTAILTGSMGLLDTANTAGFYSEQITLSAANGFENGKSYSIYIAATVNGVAGATHKTFQMLAAVNTVLVDGAAADTTENIVNAMYDEATAGHTTAGTYGKLFNDDDGKLDTISGYLDTEIAAIKAKTDIIPSDPADASDLTSQFATVNATLATIDTRIDTEVAAIKAKTDSLPSDPASASTIATLFTAVNTALTTIDDFLDTEIAAIKAKTDALPASPAAVGDVPSANANADALLNRTDGVETGMTLRQALRLSTAVLFGKATGLDASPIVFRDVNDTKPRVTVTQTASERSAVTQDAT